MPVQRPYGMLAVSIFLAACLLVFLQFLAHLGGLLNRSRGGYVDFRKTAAEANGSSADTGSLGLDYWPAEICKNLLFAVPTALLVVSLPSYIWCRLLCVCVCLRVSRVSCDFCTLCRARGMPVFRKRP